MKLIYFKPYPQNEFFTGVSLMSEVKIGSPVSLESGLFHLCLPESKEFTKYSDSWFASKYSLIHGGHE